MTFIERLKSGWTALKFIRVGIGSFILFSSIQSGLAGGIILGGLFTILSLFTNGVCFAGNNCYHPAKKNKSTTLEYTEYEELDSK